MPSGLTYVAWGFIRIRFLSHFQLHLDSGGQLHKCFHLLIDLLWLVHSYTLRLLLPLLFTLYGLNMGCHAVDLLHFPVRLDRLTTPVFASGLGFFVLMWLLHGVLLVSFLEYFSVLRGVPGDMKHTRFVTGRPISQMACIIFPALSSAVLLGVDLKIQLLLPYVPYHGWHGWHLS